MRCKQFVLGLVTVSFLAPASSVHADPGGRSGFVKVEGTRFELDGADFSFQGTNFYRIALLERHSEWEVYDTMRQLAAHGLRVVRFWAFSCEDGNRAAPLIRWATEHERGYNDEAWWRLDVTLDAARSAGLKVILPLVNFEPEYCGMEWWTKQVIGDSDKHKFYTDDRVKRAFKAHVEHLLRRVNGKYRQRYGERIEYRNDPTIMAIEVANEPHTRDWYEIERGQRPGDLVYYWLRDITAFVRSIDRKHLISSGEEGYKVSHDWGDHRDKHRWIHNGSKGVDFARNVTLPNIDFATVHIYPDNWNIPSHEMWWVREYLVKDRARIAHDAGKPIVLEEAGFADATRFPHHDYHQNRRYWLAKMYEFANEAGYAGTMVWQSVPPGRDADSYTFDFNHPMFSVVTAQAAFMNRGRRGSGSSGSYPTCRSSSSDPDGDGWGWENDRSCRVR
jgi:mannan endo-1,4-beta-mannosidase